VSSTGRWIVVAFLLLFSWMTLSSWESDSTRQRIGSSIFAGFMLTLAVGMAAPRRFHVALRVASGVVALTFLGYFAWELAALLRGASQPLAFGQPSAVLAGLGFVIFGIPAAVYAIGAERVGLARLFEHRPPSEPDDPAL
jgi:hypothetical protein